jgi:alkylation response protein AidB-like acyl-CoA dehydrogenase
MTQIDQLGSAATEAVVARAHAAVPILAAHAEQTERDLRMAPESVKAAANAGAFALTTPRRYGGLGANIATAVQVLAELGRGCGSTAWVAAISANVKHGFEPFMGDEARDEFFADPDVRICGSMLPNGRSTEVAGGLRVSGQWSYASGCEDAQWALLGAPVFDRDRMRDESAGLLEMVLVHTSSLRIDRTWNVAGLRGTGSHTLVAEDVFVPASHIVKLDLRDSQRTGLFVDLYVSGIAPLLGVAQAALDLVAPIMATRRPPQSTHANLAEVPAARETFAQASLLVEDAYQRALRIAGRADDLRSGEYELTAVEEAQMRVELISSVRQCRHAVELLLDLHGSSGFALSNPLQRMWRDLAVGSRHGALTPYVAAEDYARRLVDVE